MPKKKVGDVSFVLDLDREPYDKELNKVQQDTVRQGARAGSSFGQSFNKSLKKLDLSRFIGDNQQFADGIQSTVQAFENLSSQSDILQNKIDFSNFTSGVAGFVGGLKMSEDEFSDFGKTVEDSEQKLQKLIEKQDLLEQKHTRSNEYKQMQSDIESVELELQGLLDLQDSMLEYKSTYGHFVKEVTPEGELVSWEQLQEKIEGVMSRLRLMDEELEGIGKYGATDEEASRWFELEDEIGNARSKVEQLRVSLEQLGRGQKIRAKLDSIRKRISSIYDTVMKVPRALAKIPKFLGKTIGQFRLLNRQTNGIKRGLVSGLGAGGLLGYGALGFAIYKAFSMAKEGMENLVKYDKVTATSLNNLKASLTTLKNALGSAFAPIVNLVAPYLIKLIDLLTRAATAVAQFFAALTGKGSVVVAKKSSGVASSLDGVGSSASGANEKAQELQRTLMGFDKINKLDGNNDTGSGGGGGGSGGGVGEGFETVPVSSLAEKFADRFKDSWQKADFTWLGSLIAQKLNHALESIPWDTIQTNCNKVAKSVGTFINGFVGDFDWKLLGRTMSNGVVTALDTLATLIQTIDWHGVGKALVDWFSGINWGEVFRSAFSLAGSIAGAIGAVLVEAIKGIGSFIAKPFKDELH